MSSTSAPDMNDPALQAFWRVLAGGGWSALTMRAVAAEAGITLAELRARFASPLEMLRAHAAAVDAAVIEGTMEDDTSTARDRLFDVLMRRLDMLQPNRAGVVRLMHDLPRDPFLALWLATEQPRTMRWMLEAAGLEATGPKGALRAHGLGVIWLATLRAWEKDESEDLSATMAALDRALDQADKAARSLGLGREETGRHGTHTDHEAPEAGSESGVEGGPRIDPETDAPAGTQPT
ncbi:TetR family transcriptional regulator [Roseococcus suduntuyensis]|uniref:AcrR family transcriptional regulator n=1 Tax=Roseococcus suduntuyensis TaxID=455361 RepID=A0A840A7L6_9PROT|nr:TetR family transcriptional regulator [Roseococcus suduntuyensis]MBB3897107.1 AcrR family transcriptional regulator [Roseococcus suduntuyensis]